MNRRGFFGLFGATGPMVWAEVSTTTHGYNYETRTLARKRLVEVSDCRKDAVAGVTVLLDGEKVDLCFRAEVYSDGTGTAYCYFRDQHGRLATRRDGHPLEHARIGKVQIIPPPNVSPRVWRFLQERWLRSA